MSRASSLPSNVYPGDLPHDHDHAVAAEVDHHHLDSLVEHGHQVLEMFEVLDKLEAAGEGVVVLLTDGAEDLERGPAVQYC